MIVSKFGKSYETSDGSKQRRGDGATPEPGSGQTAAQRWDDDGGGASKPADPPPPAASEVKPAWSVLSLHDLKEAIRRASHADDPENDRQRQARSAREHACAAAAVESRRADAARVWCDRHRNAWEHT